MYPILFFVGPVGIRTAVIVVIAAVYAGAWLAARRLGKQGLPGALAYDFLTPGLLAGLVGARLWYALVFDPGWYFARPAELFAVWKGGFAEEGGFLAALAAAAWWCRRRQVRFSVFTDAVAPGVALGQALARIAALLGGSGYGTPTTLPWAITFSDPNAGAPLGIPLHPTQAYEAVAGVILTALLLLTERWTRPGQLFLLLLVGLALQRGFFDLVRGNAIWITDWLTSGQAAAAIVLMGASVQLLMRRRREVGAVFLLLLTQAPRAAGQDRQVFVTAEGAGALVILQREPSESVALGGSPHNLALSPDGKRAWLTDPSASKVRVVEVTSRTVTALPVEGRRPHGVALSPDGSRAVIAYEGSPVLEIFDAEKLTSLGRLNLPANPHNVAVSPDGGQAWVTAHRLLVVDLAAVRLLGEIELRAAPHDLAFAPDGRELWVTLWGSNEVIVVDVGGRKVSGKVTAGATPHHLGVTPDGSQVWVTNHGSGTMAVFEARSRRFLRSITVGPAPHHVAFDRDGRLAYVVSQGLNQLVVVEVASGRVQSRIPVGRAPHGVAVR